MTMTVKEANEIVTKAYAKLDEKEKSEVVSLRIGYTENKILKEFCEKLGINQSKFLRICLDFFESYLGQLTEKQLLKEVIRIKKFEYKGIDNDRKL